MITLCAFADEADEALEGQIAALKRNGIRYVELRGINGKNVSKLSYEEAKQYAAVYAENGIKVWSIGSPLGKVSIDADLDAHMELVRHVCKIAKIFGAERIRMFSFYNAQTQDEAVFALLRKMVAIAQEEGVTLCHENEKKIYGDTLERIQKIIQNVEGLHHIYDPANFLEVGEDPNETLPALHGKADYFHIKDYISKTGELVPAGVGDGQIGRIIDMLGDTDKVFSIEPHLAVFEGYAEIDSTEMKNKFTFASNDEAFDAAVAAIKEQLALHGYAEKDGSFTKAC